MKQFVRLRADWIRLIEAAHTPGGDYESWMAHVSETAKAVFPHAAAVFGHVVEHGPSMDLISARFDGPLARTLFESSKSLFGSEKASESFRAFYYPRSTVNIQRVLARRVGGTAQAQVDEVLHGTGLVDCLGLLCYPAPGVVAVLVAASERPLALGPVERTALSRIALHLDAAHRVRWRGELQVQAELTAGGRIRQRSEAAPTAEVIEAHARRVLEARSRRRRASAEAAELWSALVAGRASLVPRDDGARSGYLVLDNPPIVHGFRALTDGESAVLALAARGASTKQIAYGLGLSPSTVSSRLANAASKVGVMTRTELVRVAALLTRDPRANAPDVELTGAEREILDYLRRGMSNREIAAERSRSVRTIANQVAALLRKTGSTTRRALAASFSG